MTTSNSTDDIKRLGDLLAGKVEPPNEFVAYHLDKARRARAEHEALALAINKGDQQLAALRHRALTLRAQLESHLQAIAAWDSGAEAVDTGPAKL